MTKLHTGWILAGAFLCVLYGCGPTKTVYIPPEYRMPPPQAPAAPPPHAASKPGTPATPPSASQGPIIKPPPSITERDVPVGAEPFAPPPQKKQQAPPPPQQLASMHLVDQARASLSQGRPDAAISVLEQAIQVDVHNGEAFLLLARAWRMKGSRNKALEFARKAEILFQEDRGKLKEVYLFQADLYKEIGDAPKSDQFRQKASKL